MNRPFFFEHDRVRLFAIAHPAENPGSRPAVVLCHPYGEEKQFSDRILVGFARELARAGFPALRFDCGGYGDSQAALEDSTVERQVLETLSAAKIAEEEFGAERVVLLGLRFGATVAALAAERDASLAGLVLWSPIVLGSRYLDELIRKKLFAQIIEKGPRTSREQILDTLAGEGQVEIEGNYLTRRVSEEMAAIDLLSQDLHFAGPVLVTSIEDRRGHDEPSESLAKAYARQELSDFEIAEQCNFWDDHCLNQWYRPDDLYGKTLLWMRSRWP